MLTDLFTELLFLIRALLPACARAALRATAKELWLLDADFRLPAPVHAALGAGVAASPYQSSVEQWLTLCDTPLFALFDRPRLAVHCAPFGPATVAWTLSARVDRGDTSEHFILYFNIRDAWDTWRAGLTYISLWEDGADWHASMPCDTTLAEHLSLFRRNCPGFFAYLADPAPVTSLPPRNEWNTPGEHFRVCLD